MIVYKVCPVCASKYRRGVMELDTLSGVNDVYFCQFGGCTYAERMK